MRLRTPMLALLLAGAGSPLAAQSDIGPPGELVVGVSFHDVSGDVGSGAAAEVGYRPDWRLLNLAGPEAGGMAGSDGSAYGFAGIRVSVPVAADRIWLASSVGVGAFQGGDAIDLGGALQFRSGAELSVALWGRWLTLSFYHLSNGGLEPRNPGMEVVGLGYPLAW